MNDTQNITAEPARLEVGEAATDRQASLPSVVADEIMADKDGPYLNSGYRDHAERCRGKKLNDLGIDFANDPLDRYPSALVF